MIGKGMAISYTGESLGYAMEKDKAEVLDKNYLVGETPEEIAKEMKTFQDLNGRCKNNTFSFVLSPSIKDGKRLSDDDYRRLSRKFLKELNLEDHQSITVKHKDREHTHLHIYANRIDMQGKAADDHRIGKRSRGIADKIAQEENLTRAYNVGLEQQKEKKEEQTPVKQQIQAVFEDALKQSKTSKEFFEKVKKKGVKLTDTINRQGKVQGYRAEMKGENFKASEIGNKYTLKKIDKAIEKSVVQQQNIRHSRGINI